MGAKQPTGKMGRFVITCREINDPDWLYDAYVTQGKTKQAIADELGITIGWVHTKMKRFGIDARPLKEAGCGREWTEEERAQASARMYERWAKTPNRKASRPTAYNSRGERTRVARIVMEEKLGRPLTSEEVVHHIDEDPANNAPENLFLFPTRGTHRSFHEALKRYLRQSDSSPK